MRFGSSASALVALLVAACEGGSRPPSEGAAKPLRLGSATAPLPATASDAARAAQPKSGGCVPGTHRCVGNALEECDASSGGFVRVNVCQTSAHCNAKLKQCLVDPCILGEWQCHGADLEQCHANGWTRERQCDSAAACDAVRGRCD